MVRFRSGDVELYPLGGDLLDRYGPDGQKRKALVEGDAPAPFTGQLGKGQGMSRKPDFQEVARETTSPRRRDEGTFLLVAARSP
ncbi:MAG: hypothetical protein R2864_03965 [Syntrophotaleaceae bacterium]